MRKNQRVATAAQCGHFGGALLGRLAGHPEHVDLVAGISGLVGSAQSRLIETALIYMKKMVF